MWDRRLWGGQPSIANCMQDRIVMEELGALGRAVGIHYGGA